MFYTRQMSTVGFDTGNTKKKKSLGVRLHSGNKPMDREQMRNAVAHAIVLSSKYC